MKVKIIAFALMSALSILSLTGCSGSDNNADNVNDVLNKPGEVASNIMQNSALPSSLFSTQNQTSSANTDPYVMESSELSKEMINPFEGLEITYTGTSPYVTAAVNTSKCSDIVNQNVRFNIEKDYPFKNGDEVKVTAVSTSSQYDVSETEKTFKVENQPELVNSLDGLDLTDVKRELDDKLAAVTSANKGDSRFAGVYIWTLNGAGDFESVASSSLKTEYLITLKTQHEDKFNDYTFYNRYIRIYEYKLNRRCNGESAEPVNVYVAVYIDNIAKQTDGKLQWKLELGSSANENYDSLVNDNITSLRENYNITELKAEVKQESKSA